MRLSFSQISSYQRCPRQYEFANVKKLSRALNAGESFGSSVHNALAKWGRLEVQSAECKVQSETQMEMFADEQEATLPMLEYANLLDLWHQSFIVEGHASKQDAESARERGERVMGSFYEWWEREGRVVVGVEKGFVLEMGLSGRFDRVEEVEGGVRVIDFKTGKVRSQEEADQDLQMSIYALACEEVFGKKAVELTFLFLSDEGYEEVVTHRTRQQLDEAVAIIAKDREGIGAGNFTPTPSPQVCGCCAYRGVCDAAVS